MFGFSQSGRGSGSNPSLTLNGETAHKDALTEARYKPSGREITPGLQYCASTPEYEDLLGREWRSKHRRQTSRRDRGLPSRTWRLSIENGDGMRC
jgi:hypothetical protein